MVTTLKVHVCTVYYSYTSTVSTFPSLFLLPRCCLAGGLCSSGNHSPRRAAACKQGSSASCNKGRYTNIGDLPSGTGRQDSLVLSRRIAKSRLKVDAIRPSRDLRVVRLLFRKRFLRDDRRSLRFFIIFSLRKNDLVDGVETKANSMIVRPRLKKLCPLRWCNSYPYPRPPRPRPLLR